MWLIKNPNNASVPVNVLAFVVYVVYVVVILAVQAPNAKMFY